MFLGPINVRATRKDVQLKVKEEYNSYRVRLSFCNVFGYLISVQFSIFMVLEFHGRPPSASY